jgi:hypothetical protein
MSSDAREAQEQRKAHTGRQLRRVLNSIPLSEIRISFSKMNPGESNPYLLGLRFSRWRLKGVRHSGL